MQCWARAKTNTPARRAGTGNAAGPRGGIPGGETEAQAHMGGLRLLVSPGQVRSEESECGSIQ